MNATSGDTARHEDGPVDDGVRLAALAGRMAGATQIGLDTEFLRERTYRAQLCLIQVAFDGEAECVDPLALSDLSSLAAPLAAPGVCKIMHAARQDLEVLWPLFGRIAPVFDTQVAAALAGLPAQAGYGELVRRLLGVELSKAHTRTDWSRRPLSGPQLAYARDDVRYLAPLREALLAQLERLGRRQWLDEELAEIGAEDLMVDPEKAYERLRGLRELDPHRQRLAQQVAAWRERRAIDRDRPRGWILEDAHLRDIVMRVPRSVADLQRIDGLPAGFIEHSGDTVLQIVRDAQLPAALPPPPRAPRPDPQLTARIKELGTVVRARAAALSVSPEILATRRELEQLVLSPVDAPPDVPVLRGWRRDVIGAELLAAARAS